MASIIDHMGTIIISLSTLIAAFFVLRSEVKKYIKQSRRDVIITISKSELENLLNESYELTIRMAELTEQKISIRWEMRHSSERLIERQKYRIRSKSSISETKIKQKFSSEFLNMEGKIKDPLLDLLEKGESEIVYTSKIFAQMNANSISFLVQGFANALSVSILTLRTRLYDICRENHFLNKSEMEWEKFLEDTRIALSLDTLEQLKMLFTAYLNIPEFTLFEEDIINELRDLISDSLKSAKQETEKMECEIDSLKKEKEEIEEKIKSIQLEKNTAIINRYVNSPAKK